MAMSSSPERYGHDDLASSSFGVRYVVLAQNMKDITLGTERYGLNVKARMIRP
jgi:hypothetical protein